MNERTTSTTRFDAVVNKHRSTLSALERRVLALKHTADQVALEYHNAEAVAKAMNDRLTSTKQRVDTANAALEKAKAELETQQ